MKLLKYMVFTDEDGMERELSLGTWNGRTVLIDDNMPTLQVPLTYKKTEDTAPDGEKIYYTRSGASSAYEYSVAEPVVSSMDTYYEMATSETHYTTYVLGEDSIVLDDIGDAMPYEMGRNPDKNGGQDTLYVRDRYICGVNGISFEKPASITASASNGDLANGTNWAIINDGTTAIDHKAIAISKIISKG